MSRFQRGGLTLGLVALVAAMALARWLPELPAGLTREGLILIGVTTLMAAWWVTEAIPLAATALVPLVAFPLLGVAGIADVAGSYSDRFILLLMGGFFVATGIERWGLHRRLALWTVGRVGLAPRRLVLGFMLATAGLSMWISNTATVLMMLPIVAAVVERAKEHDPRGARALATTLLLGIAYASSIGGLGTPIGTPPNNLFMGIYHARFPEAPRISFFGWMQLGVPVVAVMLPLVWWWLVARVGRLPHGGGEAGRAVIDAERRSLGPMAPSERRIAWVFALTAAAWILREPIPLGDSLTLPGWSMLLPNPAFADDSTVAMASALAMFLIPAGRSQGPLLDWETASRIPWGLVLLFGGGIAISAGFKATGLSGFVGSTLGLLGAVHPVLLTALVALVVTFLTEVTSNTATAAILLPILASTAVASGHPPLALMLAGTLSASCAFMLPVATAPNAIVFSTGDVTVAQMARAGFWINLAGVVVITAAVWALGVPLLG